MGLCALRALLIPCRWQTVTAACPRYVATGASADDAAHRALPDTGNARGDRDVGGRRSQSSLVAPSVTADGRADAVPSVPVTTRFVLDFVPVVASTTDASTPLFPEHTHTHTPRQYERSRNLLMCACLACAAARASSPRMMAEMAARQWAGPTVEDDADPWDMIDKEQLHRDPMTAQLQRQLLQQQQQAGASGQRASHHGMPPVTSVLQQYVRSPSGKGIQGQPLPYGSPRDTRANASNWFF